MTGPSKTVAPSTGLLKETAENIGTPRKRPATAQARLKCTLKGHLHAVTVTTSPFSVHSKSEKKKRNTQELRHSATETKRISQKPEFPLSPSLVQFSSSVAEARTPPALKQSLHLKPETETGLMSLLRQIGNAYKLLMEYKCPEAIRAFRALPDPQYRTGWVLAQVARAQFESTKYSEAEKTFKQAEELDPARLEGAEYYSTCLWQLGKQVELCALARNCLARAQFVPETWCVVGNLFSLQREHETALRFFNRAIQLDPQFSYAYTLSGHECVANEDFDQAKKMYQQAISTDERHYNAWWGLGNIALRQERFVQADQYFRRALDINPRSAVLHTYLGLSHMRNRQERAALDCFEAAERLDPKNPLNTFQKATVLASMGRLNDALNVLKELGDRVPREAPVHVLMGEVYGRLGRREEALKEFNLAADLDPSGAGAIGKLVDKIGTGEGCLM